MSFDNRGSWGGDRSKPFPKEISDSELAVAYAKAQRDIEVDRIKMDDFAGIYGAQMLHADQAYVLTKEARFRRDDSDLEVRMARMATVFEAIITEQVEQNAWLGPDVTTRKTTKYDDIYNGIDAVAEIQQEIATTHMALAFDVTHGTQKIGKKMERIKEEIDRGSLATVKYFISSDETYKGQLLKVPRVVIGADKFTLKKLAELWLAGKQKDLQVHHVQLQLLDEVIAQLQAYKQYALHQGRADVALIYQRQLNLFQSIAATPDKRNLYRRVNPENTYRRSDYVYQDIMNRLSEIF